MDWISDFIKSEDLKSSLKPRDALFGGRTNAAKLYHKCSDNEKIRYYDFTSLYPFVQKTCKFPKGLPQVITENFISIENYFGVVNCVVIPPQNLLFPVLPLRINNKLVFTLCKTCAENCDPICNHSINERKLEGTWVFEEINEAIKLGYTVEKIYSIWHWNEYSQYDPVNEEGGLFTGYVNAFLKCKQENSGYPSWCHTEDDRDRYIQNYYEKEGIRLEKNKIQHNEGMRSISKLFLNSMWGRYCLQTKQNSNL